MTVKPVWMAFLLGAAVAACQKDTAGVYNPPPPLAGLRFFDAVPDTTFMDFRTVDLVQYSPNAVRARFRTGGDPNGVSNGTNSPPYQPIRTGSHDIRVFLDSAITGNSNNTLAVDTIVMFDTTMNFVENHNYTFILYGSARAKTLHALVLDDSAMAVPADNSIWVRTVNLASDTTGVGVPDVFVTTAAAPAGTPTFAAPAYLTKTAYTRIGVGALNALLTRTTTLTPITISGAFPAGVLGTATLDPIGGALVANTAMTVLILPRSTPGAGVPSAAVYANPGLFFMTDQKPPRTTP